MRGAPCAALLVTSLGLACATPGRFVCPARGGPAWREIQSDNFLLRTDLGRDAATAILDQLELLRAALLEGMFDRPIASPDRLEVLAFASREEFVELTGQGRLAGFFAQDGFGRRRIVLAGGLGSLQGTVVAHELTHLLAYQVIPRQPRWFAEGLATYFQTMGEGRGARREAGTIPRGPYLRPLQLGPVPVRTVLAWREAKEEPQLYATSWLLVHYLMNERPESFEAYQRRLARLEDPQAAWNAVFPEWSLDAEGGAERLDAALRQHLWSRNWGSTEVEVQVATTVAERGLSPAEVHSIRLDAGRSRPWAQRWAEVEEALREDPTLVAALAAGAELAPARAPALARTATAAHPEDAEAWALLGRASRGGAAAAGRLAAHLRAVELAPGRPEWRHALAVDLLVGGRATEAEAEASQAVRAAPWSPLAHWIHSAALVGLGRCREGTDALGRVLDLSAEGAAGETVKRAIDEIARAESRCGDQRLETADALALRGWLAHGQGDDVAAVELLRGALEADPRHAAAWGDLGSAQLRLGHAADAVRSFEREVELDPSDPLAFIRLARAMRALHRYDEAEAAYRKGLAQFPRDQPLQAGLAWLLLDQARPAEALEALDRLAPGDGDPRAQLLRGRAHLLLGDRGKGLRELERAVLRSGDQDVLDAAARALAVAGMEPRLAAEWANRSLAEAAAEAGATQLELFGPDQEDATRSLLHGWITAGWVSLRAGDLGRSERLFSIVERLGGDPQASAGLAEALERAGRSEEAARARARALAAEPSLARTGRWAREAAEAARSRVPGAQVELGRLRSLRLDGAPEGAAGRELLLAVGSDGTVAAVQARDAAPLAPALAALRGRPLGVTLPEGAPPWLVVPAEVECRAGTCAALLGFEPPAAWVSSGER